MEASELNSTAIDKLSNDIGVERTIRVLEFALPRIVDFENDLREYLQAGDRESASGCAHRALSSVRAYGTKRLEELLRQVNERTGNQGTLQKNLTDEFALVIGQIEAWLQEHN